MRGKELVKLLEKNGWHLNRVSGSHYIMTKQGCRSISVPVHGKMDVPKGTTAAILRQAGIKE